MELSCCCLEFGQSAPIGRCPRFCLLFDRLLSRCRFCIQPPPGLDMDRNRCQQGIKEMPSLTAGLELSEFEVQFLPFEDPFSRGSMIIDFLESRAATWGFRKYPQILPLRED